MLLATGSTCQSYQKTLELFRQDFLGREKKWDNLPWKVTDIHYGRLFQSDECPPTNFSLSYHSTLQEAAKLALKSGEKPAHANLVAEVFCMLKQKMLKQKATLTARQVWRCN